MTFKNNRAPLLSIIKLYASSHHHMWIQTGVTVRKRLSWVVTSVTLTYDLWPWPFAWTSLLSLVITPENFMMIGWWEHSQKGVTDRQTDRRTDRRTDGRTDWTIHRAAWSQLKIHLKTSSGKSQPFYLGHNVLRCRLTGIGIPIIKVRRSHDHLIFIIMIMGIPIYPGKAVLKIAFPGYRDFHNQQSLYREGARVLWLWDRISGYQTKVSWRLLS